MPPSIIRQQCDWICLADFERNYEIRCSTWMWHWKKPRNAWWSYGRGRVHDSHGNAHSPTLSTSIRFVIILQLQAVMVLAELRKAAASLFRAHSEQISHQKIVLLSILPLRYSLSLSLDISAFHFPCHNNRTTARRKPQRKLRWMPPATHV